MSCSVSLLVIASTAIMSSRKRKNSVQLVCSVSSHTVHSRGLEWSTVLGTAQKLRQWLLVVSFGNMYL